MLLLREQEIIKKANREMKKGTQREVSSRNPKYRLSIPQNVPGVARVLMFAGAMPLSWQVGWHKLFLSFALTVVCACENVPRAQYIKKMISNY
jgi:hypothetical protein